MTEQWEERTPDDLRHAMNATRDRLSETADHLEEALSSRLHDAHERVDLVSLVRRHPWPALGVAIGLGVALAASGSDRAAARGTAQVARRASRGAAIAVSRGKERVAASRRLRVHERPRRSLADRLSESILSAISADGLIDQLRSAAGELRRRRQHDGAVGA